MSGIVGIVNFDGAPVDPELMRRMTEFMTFRGPDEQRIWVDGNVGFGHTLLRTTFESEHEHQPFALDDRIWIVADARVDAQADLIAKLTSHGEPVEHGVPDVELLLRAYRVWGEQCVEHLLGDFTFAVWDQTRRHLFLARDHLGVKPLFYARRGQTVIFSNTLECIRRHPAVSDRLNDLAIADFLLFDINQDPTTTTFADVQRIPPAHHATCSINGFNTSRYWVMPIDDPIHFKRAEDYTDRFRELLDSSVNDRLRTNKLSILMSGGLDSPSLAATASKILRNRSSDFEVHAFTAVIDGIDGDERHYAQLVADALNIPIHVQDRSDTLIDLNWPDRAGSTSEPAFNVMNAATYREQHLSISKYSRVLFYGEGPDDALHYEWRSYLSFLAHTRQFGRMTARVCSHVIQHRRVPLLTTIPRMLKNWVRPNRWSLPFPNWLDHRFESRLDLRRRWNEHGRSPSTTQSNSVRPIGYKSFQSLAWDALFNGLDGGGLSAPIETRHPFVDLRLLRYMLAVPAVPWCRAKYLERRAMRGLLPQAILRRPKSPLKSDPSWEGSKRFGLPALRVAQLLREYVNWDRVPKQAGADMVRFRVNFRPYALNHWLLNLR
jgi:asparagine synthase (glutamine-hydrolysing)